MAVHSLRTHAVSSILLTALLGLFGGCAGPPRLFPAVASHTERHPDGSIDRYFDTDSDGRTDAAERLGPSGMVTALGRIVDGEMRFDIHLEQRSEGARHLLIMLDSIPYDLVADAWRHGRFRMFHPPSRTIPPFPVMTDLCVSEFLGTSPSPGVESSYYTGERLTNAYDAYFSLANMQWMHCFDYNLSTIVHGFAYLNPFGWADHEFRRIADTFDRLDRPVVLGYVVSTSGVGASFGRGGHQDILVRLDRYCSQLVHDHAGRIIITLMSDHGHYLDKPSQWVPLSDHLQRMGYRVGKTLKQPGDVVVPAFGIVTCAAIHTREPARVAADVVGLEGIELTTYRGPGDTVVILNRSGRATIAKGPRGFRYEAESGDPLELLPVIERMKHDGVTDDGWLPDEQLLDYTHDHTFVDPVHRLWRAFHGLVRNTPDVLVMAADGYHCGSKAMTDAIRLVGTHGNLRYMSSSGFVMSMAGQLPPVMRLENLREELTEIGVVVPACHIETGE